MSACPVLRTVRATSRSPGFQLRLLGIIKRIAKPLSVDAFMVLGAVSGTTRDAQVRRAITEVLTVRHFARSAPDGSAPAPPAAPAA